MWMHRPSRGWIQSSSWPGLSTSGLFPRGSWSRAKRRSPHPNLQDIQATSVNTCASCQMCSRRTFDGRSTFRKQDQCSGSIWQGSSVQRISQCSKSVLPITLSAASQSYLLLTVQQVSPTYYPQLAPDRTVGGMLVSKGAVLNTTFTAAIIAACCCCDRFAHPGLSFHTFRPYIGVA